MKNYTLYSLFILLFLISACKEEKKEGNTNEIVEEEVVTKPFLWEASNMYFLLTDRFNNGDTTNDTHFDRTEKTAVLRGFEGGDLKGIKNKMGKKRPQTKLISKCPLKPFLSSFND